LKTKKIQKIFLGGSFLAWLSSPVKVPKKHNFKNAIIKIVNQCQANLYHIKIPWLILKWFPKCFAAKICLFGIRLHIYWAQFNLKMTRIFFLIFFLSYFEPFGDSREILWWNYRWKCLLKNDQKIFCSYSLFWCLGSFEVIFYGILNWIHSKKQ
jgi:hypothetical protein